MHPCLRHALALTAIQCVTLSSSTAAEYEFFETLPLVLSGSRLPQSLPDAPGAVSVIDADMIAATGYRDLARVLRLVPGFQVAQERGGKHWVTYHGLGMDVPQQMRVIVDGRPSPSAHFNQLPERILLQDIERIEVLRGSNSAAYGSNAFHGAINVTTRHSASENGSALRFTAGTEGISGLSARHTAGGGLHSLRITATHEKDDGFDGLRDGTRTNALSLRSDLQLSTHDEITLSANVGESVVEEGYADSIFNTAKERTAHNHGQALLLRWRHASSADDEWLLTASWDRQKIEDAWQLDTTINMPSALVGLVPALTSAVGNDLAIDYHTLELQQQTRLNRDSRLAWGTELRHTRNESAYYFSAEREVSRLERRVFANLEWRSAPAWLWNFAGMIEQVQGDSARFAPRAFLNWQPDPDRTWRLGYSRAWRQPALFERRADIRILDQSGTLLQWRQMPAQNLQPQRIDAVELGYLGVSADRKTTLDVRLFHERIDDLIVRNPVAGDLPAAGILPDALRESLRGTRWKNDPGQVRLSGVEYQLRTRPLRTTEFILAHSMIDRRADDEKLRRNVAPYTASLSWLQEMGPWNSMLSVLRMGPIDAGFSYAPGFKSSVPAYTTVDWSMARRLRVRETELEVRLSGINLLGKHQELVNRLRQSQSSTYQPVNEVGRQIYLSLQTQF